MLTVPWTSAKSHAHISTLTQISRLELGRARDVPGFPSRSGCPLRRTFWTLSTWNDETAIAEFVKSDVHVAVMVKYRDRMAGSHFHTWTAAGPSTNKPSWLDAHRRYETTQESP